jgi:hypothetical protein
MPTGAARGDMSGDMNGAHERGDGHHDGAWEAGTLAPLSPLPHMDGAGASEGTPTPATDNSSLPPERWLRDDTVDELRDARARSGLARPARVPSIPRPPLAEAPRQISSYRAARATTPPSASRLFISVAAGAVIGLLIGILAALAIHPDHLPIPGL